ncbi:potassium channel family protein [Nocardioides sp. Arc9.136]|uniref:potassium channel family protein n=1 Tax=Nocardioides sp. Arc9.136 TaxID=2996826 RepID=UPI002665E036|nr:potassium channel family protein [Nocardioides sp. Arc9.136]WKN47524.1 potassium channel family protein [Nocardioides sp. Arc9.136]
MTTVGYGDEVPVTTGGRLVGLGLMIAGVALLGSVTATLASWLVHAVAREDAAQEVGVRDETQALRAEIAGLRHQVTELVDLLRPAGVPDPADPDRPVHVAARTTPRE